MNRHHYWSCSRKVRYKDQQAAQSKITELGDPTLEIYSCVYCEGFHIGHDITPRNARKSLARLQKIMDHPNFLLKAPAEVIERLTRTRERMEQRLRFHE